MVFYAISILHTGVEYCLFVRGFARASSQMNEWLHTFFYV